MRCTLLLVLLAAGCTKMTQNPPVDPAKIALDLWTRSTPKAGEVASRATVKAALEAAYTEDAEQVNGFGVYSSGREPMLAAAENAVIANRTAGFESTITSATLLADNVILAHALGSAEVPEGPLAGRGRVQFRFTLVIVKQDGAWKIRSASTTLVQPPPS
jgi:uncharacterized protein (TIGR02246 family)